MKEYQATFVGLKRIEVGSVIQCDYNGKRRHGVVDKVLGDVYSATQLSVNTDDSFRRFNISGIYNLVVKG